MRDAKFIDVLGASLFYANTIVDEYPILAWRRKAQQAYLNKSREQIIKQGDRFGNFVYNKNIPVVSDYVAGLFNASDREKNGSLVAAQGSFANGFLGNGVLGTVDGIATLATDGTGVAEGVIDFLRNSKRTFPAVGKKVDDFIENAKLEDWARVGGTAAFEVFSAIMTSGGASAVKAGDTAADTGALSKLAKAADALDDTENASDFSAFTKFYDELSKIPELETGGSGVKINVTLGWTDDVAIAGERILNGEKETLALIDNQGFDTSRINIAKGQTRFSPSKNAGLQHVQDRHFSPGKNAGQFNIPVDELKDILAQKIVIKTPGTPSTVSGQYTRVVDIGKVVGTIKPNIPEIGGKPTTWITIITDTKGNLITTYPCPAPK